MRSQIIALGLAGTAIASYAPPAYGGEESSSASVPSYGAETTSAPAPPVYKTTSAPAPPVYEATTSVPAPPTYETPKVPSYGESSSKSSYSESATKPHEYPTTSSSVPSYPAKTTTEETTVWTTIPCESTTITYGPSTYVVSSKTILTVPVTKPVYSVPTYAPSVSKSTPYSPEQPSSSVHVPVYTPTPSASWTTKPAAPYYPTGGNATVPATSSPSASQTHPATYTGAASKAVAGAMVGVSGLLAALFL